MKILVYFQFKTDPKEKMHLPKRSVIAGKNMFVKVPPPPCQSVSEDTHSPTFNCFDEASFLPAYCFPLEFILGTHITFRSQ